MGFLHNVLEKKRVVLGFPLSTPYRDLATLEAGQKAQGQGGLPLPDR